MTFSGYYRNRPSVSGTGAQSRANRARIDRVLSSLPLEPTTRAIGHRAGEIDGKLQRRDDGTGAVDAIVGATVLEYDKPVVTANVSQFERTPGVDVEHDTVGQESVNTTVSTPVAYATALECDRCMHRRSAATTSDGMIRTAVATSRRNRVTGSGHAGADVR